MCKNSNLLKVTSEVMENDGKYSAGWYISYLLPMYFSKSQCVIYVVSISSYKIILFTLYSSALFHESRLARNPKLQLSTLAGTSAANNPAQVVKRHRPRRNTDAPLPMVLYLFLRSYLQQNDCQFYQTPQNCSFVINR